jgi:hypothetical protein
MSFVELSTIRVIANAALPAIEKLLETRWARGDLDTKKSYIKVQKKGDELIEVPVGRFVRSYRMGSGDGMTIHWDFEKDGIVSRIDDEMWGSVGGAELLGFKEVVELQ